jgi:hypothetical protein
MRQTGIMKQILVSAFVAALVCGIAFALFGINSSGVLGGGAEESPAATASLASGTEPQAALPGLSLTVTDALPEDVWVDGSRQSGDDHRILTSAETSVCFISRIELAGVSSPEDAAACTMQIDDFTGFWDLVVSVPEGSQSHIRCNARCLTWE